MRSTTLPALLALLALPSAAAAQGGLGALEEGARVRITRPCATSDVVLGNQLSGSCQLIGRFIQVSGDTIVVQSADRVPVRNDLAAIQRLEISVGSSTRARRGAVVGLLAGGLGTYGVLHSGGSTALCDRSANQDAASSTECLLFVGLGGLIGAGLGTLIGSMFRTETWRELAIREASRISVDHRGLGLRFEVSIGG